jgi:hypothetical protein
MATAYLTGFLFRLQYVRRLFVQMYFSLQPRVSGNCGDTKLSADSAFFGGECVGLRADKLARLQVIQL